MGVVLLWPHCAQVRRYCKYKQLWAMCASAVSNFWPLPCPVWVFWQASVSGAA